MSGWKTKLAGAASIGWGLYQIVEGRSDEGMRYVIEGLAVLGIGHKLDRLRD